MSISKMKKNQMKEFSPPLYTWQTGGKSWVFHKRHIMPEKLMTVLLCGAERVDFAIWIILLFVMEMYLLVHKKGHSQKTGVSEKGGYEKVLR